MIHVYCRRILFIISISESTDFKEDTENDNHRHQDQKDHSRRPSQSRYLHHRGRPDRYSRYQGSSGRRKTFRYMPSRKDENGVFRDIVHPISPDARQSIESQILDAYTRHIEMMQAEAEAEEAGLL